MMPHTEVGANTTGQTGAAPQNVFTGRVRGIGPGGARLGAILGVALLPFCVGGQTPARSMVLPAPNCFCLSANQSAAPAAQPAQPAAPENANFHVHDPCIAKAGDWYYVYSTGPGIPFRRSRDLVHWQFVGRVFSDDVPGWAKTILPQSSGIWAPDISFYNKRWHLFYSVSTFGRNHSVIGTASTPTLDPSDKAYHWTDEGKVIESKVGDNYNAIDPNILPLPGNRLALTFGSFWSGIKQVTLDARTNQPTPDAPVVAIAQRPEPPDAIEAPFLIRRGKWHYLFAGFDFCCRGVNSTYNVRVGRSESVSGPFLDRDGKSMQEGGGTMLISSQGREIGVGHCAVLHDGRRDYLVYHFYDGDKNGLPTLGVRPLTWTSSGWPEVGASLATK